MSISGVIKTLFSDHKKTQAIFPRTKVSAVSDDNGVGLGALLDDIKSSAIQMTLLWENASPSSYFNAQTISLDLSEYDEVQVYFNIHGNYLRLFPFTLPVGSSGHVTNDQGTSLETTSQWCQYIERDMTVSTTGVTFGSGTARGPGSGSAATDDWVIVPTRIYGIKGVS